MSVLSVSACICYLTKPYLTQKGKYPPTLTLPGAASPLDLTQSGATLSQPLARHLLKDEYFQIYQNLGKYILGQLKLTCAKFLNAHLLT
jgi:hypothetical protein